MKCKEISYAYGNKVTKKVKDGFVTKEVRFAKTIEVDEGMDEAVVKDALISDVEKTVMERMGE